MFKSRCISYYMCNLLRKASPKEVLILSLYKNMSYMIVRTHPEWLTPLYYKKKQASPNETWIHSTKAWTATIT